MKKGEYEDCQKNGVKDIVEINIGFDGMTMAQSKQGAPIKLTLAQLFLALAKEVPGPDGKLVANPYRNWSDIDRPCPTSRSRSSGRRPPPARAIRCRTVHGEGRRAIPALVALKKSDPKAFERAWKSLREDGAYVEAGENDNLIVQKLEANRNAFGIFGFSFLDENSAKLRGVPFDGVEPTYENIANGKYKGARRCSSTSRSSTSAWFRALTSSPPSMCPRRPWARTAIWPRRGWSPCRRRS